MEENINKDNQDREAVIEYWKTLEADDLEPLRLSQKIDHYLDDMVALMDGVKEQPTSPAQQYLSFHWSNTVRDFSILLRDTLLNAVKVEQISKDDQEISESYADEIKSVVEQAATVVSEEYAVSKEYTDAVKEWKHQLNPIPEVNRQLRELQKQCKKIYRSSSKIDDIRSNIHDYVKDFQLQYTRQCNAVKQLFTIVEEVQNLVKGITSESSKTIIEATVDQIGENSLKLDLVKGTESMEILPYANSETINFPVSTSNGSLYYKSINAKSEFARWFSAFIYPKIVELESRRDHAVEKCNYAFSQIRTKVAAIALSDMEDHVDIQREFDSIFILLEKEVLAALRHEEEELNKLVNAHLKNYLLASNVFSEDKLFLPESGGSQISNISKDAQKRILSNLNQYKNDFSQYLNTVLSRYFEIDKTPYSQYVQNLVSIHDEDESLALFLKKGYLGKSFTVQRPEVINPIIEDYKLWLDGFAGAILLSGLSGSGKSTLLGMINHLGLSEEIIQLSCGESYFVRHKSFEPRIEFEELIRQVVYQTRGRKVVVCIDDLEMWHDEEIELFDNIARLFEAISKYRRNIFFIVTCSPFLKERLQLFKDLNSVFSYQTEIERMNSNQIRDALNLRARVNDKMKINESELDSRFGHIIRESKGNIGLAMLEYCRFHNENYKPSMKSQEFNELVRYHHVLLLYMSSYYHTSLKVLKDTLSEMDYRSTKKSIDHLVGQKILVRPRSGYVAINPLIIHRLELALAKYSR